MSSNLGEVPDSTKGILKGMEGHFSLLQMLPALTTAKTIKNFPETQDLTVGKYW
jgi:hypothetical protein